MADVVWLSLVGDVGEAKVLLTGDVTGELRSSLVFFFLRKPSDGIVCRATTNSAPRSCARTKRLRLRVLIYHNDVSLRKRGWGGRWPVMVKDDNGELKLELELELELCKQEREGRVRDLAPS